LLCYLFIEKFVAGNTADIQGIAPEAMQILFNHSWPGNVRELENIMERAVILAENKMIQPENLPKNLTKRKDSQVLDDLLGTGSIKKARQIVEQQLIARALEETDGNKSKAARILEISYPSLLNKIKEYWGNAQLAEIS